MDPVSLGFLFVVMVVVLVLGTAVHRKAKARELVTRGAFIAAYSFPPELDRRLARRLPQLSAEQRRLVLEGLRQYFLLVVGSRRGRIARYLGMPSKAVDEAWHEFIVMTRDYAAFCQRAFGQYLHHRPAAQMEEGTRDALANTLHQFKRGAPHGAAWAMVAGVPLLFALDRQLALADGHIHDEASLGELEARRQAMVASGGESSFSGSSGRDDDGVPGDSPGDAGSDGGGGGCGGGGGGCGGS